MKKAFKIIAFILVAVLAGIVAFLLGSESIGYLMTEASQALFGASESKEIEIESIGDNE